MRSSCGVYENVTKCVVVVVFVVTQLFSRPRWSFWPARKRNSLFSVAERGSFSTVFSSPGPVAGRRAIIGARGGGKTKIFLFGTTTISLSRSVCTTQPRNTHSILYHRVAELIQFHYSSTTVPGYPGTVPYGIIYTVRVSLSYCTVRLELLCFEQVWSSVVALRPGDGVPSILLLSHFFLKNENTDLCPLGTGFCAIFAFFFAGP